MSDTSEAKQANARRKRKDPESRDFTCECGKSYLSYAAAYTHVKNKHDLDKRYVQKIKKPQRQQLKRGRPKEKKENVNNYENTLLTLIESAILKVSMGLQHVFSKTILQGNEEKSQERVNKYLQQLWEKHQLELKGMKKEVRFEVEQFGYRFNKDFPEEIASKIDLAIRIISNQGQAAIQTLDGFDLWRGQNKINRIIWETYKQWEEVYKTYFQPFT